MCQNAILMTTLHPLNTHIRSALVNLVTNTNAAPPPPQALPELGG